MVRSLQLKKFRDELGLFVAEGEKCVEELCKAFELVLLVRNQGLAESRESRVDARTVYATQTEIEQMSGLRTPQGVIAVFKKKPLSDLPLKGQEDSLILALDGVQDPGNMGTIIRTCDWFGVHDIICSRDTADCYNPKVVQATMGALARVRVHYVDLPAMLEEFKIKDSKLKIYGTLLDGKDLYEAFESRVESQEPKEIIVMGNEGNGISEAVRKIVTHPIRIPSYPKNAETSESLNVSIATAIVLAEFRRTAD